MAFDFNRAWKIAQAIFGAADVSRRALGGGPAEPIDTLPAAGGVFGQLEARLTGVVISALKEAFDRDAARLDIERAAMEEQRRRAEEALRLELVRQSGERALARVRTIGGAALLIWVVSVIFAMRFPVGLAGAGRMTLALGWALLVGALAASLAAHTTVSRWIAQAQGTQAGPADVPQGGAAAAAPWLVLAGLVLVGASLLVAL
jgi:hypothetical protein